MAEPDKDKLLALPGDGYRMDTVTKEKRSYIMSRIRSKNTGPERRMAMLLVRSGFNFHKWSDLPGRPDFVLSRHKVAIFVDGCFFHGCPTHGTMPKSNTAFWRDKIKKNRARNRNADKVLQGMGYSVWRFWEHSLRKNGRPERVLRHLDVLTLAEGPSGRFRVLKARAGR